MYRYFKDFDEILQKARKQLGFLWLEQVADALSSALETEKRRTGAFGDKSAGRPGASPEPKG